MKKTKYAEVYCTVDDGVNKPCEVMLNLHHSFQLIARLRVGESDFVTTASITVNRVYVPPS